MLSDKIKNIRQPMKEVNFENYVNEDVKKNLFYKIALLGSSRVGKTSTIVALLDEAKESLRGSGVSIKAYKSEDGLSPTGDRIEKTIQEIEGGLDHASFAPTGSGTGEPFIFDLVMSVTNQTENTTQLRFAFLDYPGGWLNNNNIQNQHTEEWEQCQQWIKDSSILIIPIDSVLVMEADNPERSTSARQLLEIEKVKQLVEDWAKGRVDKQESARLLLVPVKCESYFNDNGGSEDKSEELYKKITERYYNGVIKTAIDELHQIESEVIEKTLEEVEPENNKLGIIARFNKNKVLERTPLTYKIEYHPVDTIGCIELKQPQWETVDGKLNLKPEYLVRNASDRLPQRTPLGTIGLLASVCQQIVHEKLNNSGLFDSLWNWFSGKNKILKEALIKLSEKNNGSRFKIIDEGNIRQREY